MFQQAIRLFLPLLAAAQSAADSPADYADLPEGVLHFPLSKPGLQERVELFRRASDYTGVSLKNEISMFSASIQIGSNNQNVTVLVDTGSSDLWVMSSDNPYCSSSGSSKYKADEVVSKARGRTGKSSCYKNSQFDAADSKTFTKNNTAFHISYGDGSFANGTYCQDTIKYGSAEIQKANFAYANTTDSQISVWGIGLKGLEATSRTYDESGNFSPTYSNLPIQMKEQGIIKQNAYSLWLDDLDATSGSLLFGGVDHSKYKGTLQTVPLLSTYQGAKPNEMQVKLDKISVYQGSNRADVVQCAFPALLDSGTTYMMLPNVFLDAIMQSIGGVYSQDGACFATCGLEGGLSFEFSGIKIDVPFSEFEFQVSSASNICQLGMLPNGDSMVLGDTFLRSAYVVYDLDNLEVSMAASNTNSTDSASIDVISNSVPSASKAPGYSSTSVGNSYTTSIATFVTGKGNVASNGQLTTTSIPKSGLSGANTGTFAGESTKAGGGGIFETLFTSTVGGSPSATGDSSGASSSSQSGKRSKNMANRPHGDATRVGLFSTLFTSIMGALLYF